MENNAIGLQDIKNIIIKGTPEEQLRRTQAIDRINLYLKHNFDIVKGLIYIEFLMYDINDNSRQIILKYFEEKGWGVSRPTFIGGPIGSSSSQLLLYDPKNKSAEKHINWIDSFEINRKEREKEEKEEERKEKEEEKRNKEKEDTKNINLWARIINKGEK